MGVVAINMPNFSRLGSMACIQIVKYAYNFICIIYQDAFPKTKLAPLAPEKKAWKTLFPKGIFFGLVS